MPVCQSTYFLYSPKWKTLTTVCEADHSHEEDIKTSQVQRYHIQFWWYGSLPITKQLSQTETSLSMLHDRAQCSTNHISAFLADCFQTLIARRGLQRKIARLEEEGNRASFFYFLLISSFFVQPSNAASFWLHHFFPVAQIESSLLCF